MPRPRPVGPDRRTAAIGLTGLAGFVGLLGLLLATPGDASPRPEPAPAAEPLRVGMNSCAARGCHGAVEATDPGQGRVYIKDGAFTTWLHYDPHARAYAVLLEPRSRAIAARLKASLADKPAHEAGLCLSCHATSGPPAAKAPGLAPLADGISCEACHGPAEAWQDKHLDPAWRALPARTKALDGWADLESPAARVRACVGCHVGDRSRGMDMNHDLIAAGHPRLNFEFATYQAGYPKHWKEPHEKPGAGEARSASADFEARSWAVGQVVTADAVLNLLAARALASKEGAERKAPAPEAAWPEFSEYECFACHHDLTNPSPRQQAGHALGRLPWETWPLAMLPSLAEGGPAVDLAGLRAEMGRHAPRADEVARLADEARGQLDALLRSLEGRTFDAAAIEAWSRRISAGLPTVVEGWDRAAQHVLALEALTRATKASGRAVAPGVEAAVLGGSKSLDFPPGFDSPRAVSTPSNPKSPPRSGP